MLLMLSVLACTVQHLRVYFLLPIGASYIDEFRNLGPFNHLILVLLCLGTRESSS